MRIIARAVVGGIAAVVVASCAPPLRQESAQVRSASPSAAAEAFVASVHRTVLPNGLTVLIREQRGTGIAAVNTWVKAGYFHEPDEVAGMAHLFEHMFFKGSQRYPGPEAIAHAIAGAGGRTNASTIYTHTSYDAVLPKESLVQGIEVQADAIAHPLFDAAELRKEAEVVIEESNRKFDNPGPVAFERMLATSFTQHRIKRWRIGSNEVLRNIRRDHLVDFFETLYRPENIIVTITGDVDPVGALAVVQRTFGAIPRGTLKKQRGPAEPPQQEFRFGRSESDIKEGHTVLGWHTVAENHPDEVTLDVLASILGRGRSSRLYRGVVGPSGATMATALHNTNDDVGVFAITGVHPEANRAEVEKRIVAEVERIKRFGPTQYELAKAKTASEVGFLGAMDTALGQAHALSANEAQGSYRLLATRLKRLESVTADEIRDAARRYLSLERLTLYNYQPKGAPMTTRERALERLRTAQAVEVGPLTAQALPDLANSARVAAVDAPLRMFQLSNGASVALQQRTGTPLVAAGLFFRGGRIEETEANAGITRLMMHVMRRGTSTRDAEAIDRDIEFIGAQLGLVAWEDGFGFEFRTLTRFFEPALAIASQVLLDASFPEEGIAREKSLQAAAWRRSTDSATDRPMQLYRAAMFGAHPYARTEFGTARALASIDRAALQAWWKSTIAADRALIVVVGNIDADDLRRLLEEKLARLPRSTGPVALPPPPRSLPARAESTEQRDRVQTAMVLAYPTAAPSDPDWHAFRLMQSVTSGLSGTFFRELRARRSLAYVVRAGPQAFAQQGVFVAYMASEASKEEAGRQAMLAQVRAMAGDGITEDDVTRAKAFFAGSTRIGRETTTALVNEYGRNYVLGSPLDQVDRTLAVVPSLHAADLRDVAWRYLSGENYVYAAVRGHGAAAPR